MCDDMGQALRNTLERITHRTGTGRHVSGMGRSRGSAWLAEGISHGLSFLHSIRAVDSDPTAQINLSEKIMQILEVIAS